ncbi:hypothetical protein L7F22_037424, partial [Adiantum nelumboides]|nr:hypothetical protein [Adiantum nelumboides]
MPYFGVPICVVEREGRKQRVMTSLQGKQGSKGGQVVPIGSLGLGSSVSSLAGGAQST